jgi:hypothetical protein
VRLRFVEFVYEVEFVYFEIELGRGILLEKARGDSLIRQSKGDASSGGPAFRLDR